VHIKDFSDFELNDSNLGEPFLTHLNREDQFLLWEDRHELPGGLFDFHLGTQGLTALKGAVPETMDEIRFFEPQTYFPFKVRFEDQTSGSMMRIGNFDFLLDPQERLNTLGFQNRDLILFLSQESFEISRKEKQGFQKIKLLSQSQIGHSYRQCFDFEGTLMSRRSEKRCPVPFLHLKPLLSKAYVFQPETGKRLLP